MTDIILENEDFKVVKSNHDEFDIHISDDDEVYKLIRRAVETPFEYIGRYVIDSNGLRGLDYDFGDPIYNSLSEGLTINLISTIRSQVRDAISKVTPDVTIDEIIIQTPNFDTINIQIQINGLEKPIVTQVSL